MFFISDIVSVETKRKIREKKGNPPIKYIEDECKQGKNTGELIMKPIRQNILDDVLNLIDRGKTKEEIHIFGCEKYHFRDSTPWEDRYFNYIKENH